MLPIRSRVDLGPMAMKGYSALPKAPALLEPFHQIFSIISRTFVGVGSYPSAEVQSVYSTALADWACCCMKVLSVRQTLECSCETEHRLWLRPYFFNSAQHVFFVLLGCFVRCVKQLPFCGVLFPGYVRNNTLHSCAALTKHFLHSFFKS